MSIDQPIPQGYVLKFPADLNVGDVIRLPRRDYKPRGTECKIVKIEPVKPDDEFTTIYAETPKGILYYRLRNISKHGNRRRLLTKSNLTNKPTKYPI